MTFKSVRRLEERMSEPSPALVAMMERLDGDVLILGAGGKIGPTLSRMARRAVEAAGVDKDVIAMDLAPLPDLEECGIKTLVCDLLDLEDTRRLPRVRNVVFMAGRKFGSTDAEPFTWAVNVIAPYHVASTFVDSRVVVFSTGCVYPVVDLATGGATEETAPDPVGEYAMSCLGRERMFDYFSEKRGEKVVHVRLNYAVETRYGVLVDVAQKVWNGEAVDVTTGYANVIWQGDACDRALRCLELASSPPTILNVTGPETFSIRWVAHEFGRLFGKDVKIRGEENGRGYLSNATRANRLFGNPSVPLGRIIEWTAAWIKGGGASLDKPTHFETQDGKY